MKLIFTLLKKKKSISKPTSMLMSATKEVYLQNQDLFTLSSIKKDIITLQKSLKLKVLIY